MARTKTNVSQLEPHSGAALLTTNGASLVVWQTLAALDLLTVTAAGALFDENETFTFFLGVL